MRVIDLLNKIANGEEIPSPIYHNNLYYDFEDGDYFNQKTMTWLFNSNNIDTILNDEVEVIEEDKKIERLDTKDLFTCDDYQNIRLNFGLTWSKINEIIDYINKEK